MLTEKTTQIRICDDCKCELGDHYTSIESWDGAFTYDLCLICAYKPNLECCNCGTKTHPFNLFYYQPDEPYCKACVSASLARHTASQPTVP